MAALRNIRLLLWRNYVKRKRAMCSFCCELWFPVIVVLLFVGLFRAFSVVNVGDSMYINDMRPIGNLAGMGFRLENQSAVLALVAGDGAGPEVPDLLSELNATIAQWYPALNPTDAFPSSPALQARVPFLPSLASRTVRFDSETQLRNYVKSLDYTHQGFPEVDAAIVLISGPPNWEYKIRVNNTEIPDTNVKVDNIQIDSKPEFMHQYTWPSRTYRGNQKPAYPIQRQFKPGFSSYQVLMDRFIMKNVTTAAPQLPEGSVLTLLYELGSYIVTPNAQAALGAAINAVWSDNTQKNTAVSFLRQAFTAELQLPQRVSVGPFPTTAYKKNDFFTTTSAVFAFLFSFSFLYPASRLLRDIVREKELKMREGMRAMGLGTGSLLSSWYITYIFISLFQAIVITIITKPNIFKNSNPGPIFIMFFLFGLATMASCMVISVFFSRAKTAMVLGLLILFGSIFPYIAVSGSGYSNSAKVGASILPSTAFALCLDRIAGLESSQQGANPGNMNIRVNNYALSDGLGMLFLMTLVFLLLTWYLDNVLPSEFGVPLHPWFPFTKKYWRETCSCCKRRRNPPITTENQLSHVVGRSAAVTPAPGTGKAPLVEAPDTRMNALAEAGKTLELHGLRKEFTSVIDKTATRVAVDGVDLTMYEGQIFVLLGHNGAGKTTTASMITGLLAPTAGSISVYGRQVPEQLDEVRYDIGMGVCPQHDVLYHDLTVKEHLELFAGIKGVPRKDVAQAVQETIATVGLTEKVDARADSLSGGMKRKLSVGIALIGGSKVVILDEPTSGMDPYSRRSTWQMLKNAREGRIMILTTHFMDEADLLGDRIAIMANGRVACCGSPMFLKHNYGVGYQMTMVKASSGTKVDDVTAIVKTIDGAELISNVGTELSFRLPMHESGRLPGMLAQLDENLEGLGIRSYGIGVTTMEEVFLRVAEEGHEDAAASAAAEGGGGEGTVSIAERPSSRGSQPKRVNVQPATPPSSADQSDVEGGNGRHTIADLMKHARHDGQGMFFKHMRALLIKRFQYFKRDLKGFMFLVFIPIAVVLAIVALLSTNPFSDFPDIVLSTSSYNLGRAVPNRVPYMNYKAATPNVGPPGFTGIVDAMNSMQSISPGNREVVLPLDSTVSVANSSGFIDKPVNNGWDAAYLHTYQVLNQYLLNNKSAYAESKYGAYMFDGTWMDPQPADVLSYTILQNTTSVHATSIYTNLINSALYNNKNGGSGSIKAHNFPLPYTRRQDVVLSGVLSFFIALGIVIGFAFVSAFYASFLVYERENNVKHQQLISGVSINAYWISTLVWDVVLFQIPMWICIIILKAFDVKELTGSYEITQATILLFFFFGISTAGITYCLTYLFKSASTAQNVVIFLNVICMFLIMGSFIMGRIESTCTADESLQKIWMLLPAYAVGYGFVKLAFLDILPALLTSCHGGITPGSKPVVYAPLDMDATGINILYMGVTAIGYFLIAVIIDYLIANPWVRQKFVFGSKPLTSASSTDGALLGEDSDVTEERRRVAALTSNDSQDVLVLKDVRKVYKGGKQAVKSLAFGVPIGQCFGFLGINGAGKTTTLKILSGEFLPTSGSASIAGFDILTQQMQLRRLLGYCPQFDALYDLLTVKEHLELYARIKGIPEPEIARIVSELIVRMDLKQFEHKRAGTLSGGNKRKLSVAVALIGEPPVVFLDEPSTGMDPVSRRKLWNIIARVASEQQICSVILTTHSMEECEALCSRLGIMVDGALQCLGSIQHLKAKFGTGFSAEFKLGDPRPDFIAAIAARMNSAMNGRPNIDLLNMPRLCAALGLPNRANEISESGSGWALFTAFQKAGATGIPVQSFAEWWADEDQADGLAQYMTHHAFPGSQLVERHGSKLFFHLPPQTMTLGAMFEKLEQAKAQLNIMEYSLSQTTLEQIFNKFAAMQEAESGVARGMVAATEARTNAFFKAHEGSPQAVAKPQ